MPRHWNLRQLPGPALVRGEKNSLPATPSRRRWLIAAAIAATAVSVSVAFTIGIHIDIDLRLEWTNRPEAPRELPDADARE